MQYTKLNGIGRPVSRFGMGCMRLPQTKAADGADTIDEKESVRMIRHAIDSGVNYLDTAYAYPGSEELLGKALKDGYREKVLIATKCPMWDVKSQEDYQRLYNEQTTRLQTDFIDIYLFHCLDRDNWEKVKKSDGIAFMEQLKAKGGIGKFGFSFHGDDSLFKEIIDAHDWDICMIQLNILDENHQAGLKGLRYAASKGIPVVIMEPLKGGLLGGSAPDEVGTLLEAYKEKRSLVEWAFRWLYSMQQACVILSGVSGMAQLEDNLRIFGEAKAGVMSEDDKRLMQQIKAIYTSKVRVSCTGCGYCMPCPVGVNIPEIFKVYNDAALSDWTEYGKAFYSLVVASSDKDASNCIECRQCESHCPQAIDIVETLKEAHAAMKG